MPTPHLHSFACDQRSPIFSKGALEGLAAAPSWSDGSALGAVLRLPVIELPSGACRSQKPTHLVADGQSAPDDVAFPIPDHPHAPMLIQLEFQLDLARQDVSVHRPPAAVVDRVGHHRGICRGLMEPRFVKFRRKSHGHVAEPGGSGCAGSIAESGHSAMMSRR